MELPLVSDSDLDSDLESVSAMELPLAMDSESASELELAKWITA